MLPIQLASENSHLLPLTLARLLLVNRENMPSSAHKIARYAVVGFITHAYAIISILKPHLHPSASTLHTHHVHWQLKHVERIESWHRHMMRRPKKKEEKYCSRAHQFECAALQATITCKQCWSSSISALVNYYGPLSINS